MKLIDTHCHLAHRRLGQQVPEVLQRARDAGVVAAICAAGDVLESRATLEIAREHEGISCLAGVHPHAANEVSEGYLAQIEQLTTGDENVGVGEIGLDYHYDFSPREDQRRVFAEQLQLAVRIGKAIVVHTREAFDDTMGILREAGVDGSRVVFHSFTGTSDEARRAMEIGATISFSGIVTFKRSDDLRTAAAFVPAEKILIETDAPFLSPEPVRKIRTNEPAHVAHVAACLAAVRNTTPDAIAELTTANAVRFFGLEEV